MEILSRRQAGGNSRLHKSPLDAGRDEGLDGRVLRH